MASQSEINRKIREAQRQFEQQFKREVDRVNRVNTRIVDDYNRKAEAHNRRVVNDHNRKIETHNRKVISEHNTQVQEHNRKVAANHKQVVSNLNRSQPSLSSKVHYTPEEQGLAERVHQSVSALDARDYDSFLSYARIDGATVANQLRAKLEDLNVAVWFDEVAIVPGRSQSLQMDSGLRKARSGIVLLTPAYLTGRFWTERELGVLLSKKTLIPVLHGVTFDDVQEYSGILTDLAGFSTTYDSISDIGEKIAAAVLVEMKQMP